MDALKKIGATLLLLLWLGGIICGLFLSIGSKSLVVILSIVLLGLMSVPTAKKLLDFLKS